MRHLRALQIAKSASLETIITCSTHRPDESDDPILEKPFSYLWEQKGRGKGQPAPSSVDEMSKFIVQFSIDFINRATWYVETSEKSAMQIFADTVNEKVCSHVLSFHKRLIVLGGPRSRSVHGLHEEDREKVKRKQRCRTSAGKKA